MINNVHTQLGGSQNAPAPTAAPVPGATQPAGNIQAIARPRGPGIGNVLQLGGGMGVGAAIVVAAFKFMGPSLMPVEKMTIVLDPAHDSAIKVGHKFGDSTVLSGTFMIAVEGGRLRAPTTGEAKVLNDNPGCILFPLDVMGPPYKGALLQACGVKDAVLGKELTIGQDLAKVDKVANLAILRPVEGGKYYRFAMMPPPLLGVLLGFSNSESYEPAPATSTTDRQPRDGQSTGGTNDGSIPGTTPTPTN